MNKKIIFGFIGVILIGMIFTMIIYFKKENESVENIKELELLENSIIINFTGHTDTVVKEDVENGENKKEDLNLEVILGDDFFVYKNSSIMKIYNFKTRKIVIANLENNTYEEFSLYSDLGLRLSEFKNSSRINELLDHGDSSSEQILDKTLLEHQFSLQGESLENNINISFENDKTRMSYSDKDKLLFEYTRDFSDDLEEKYKVSIDEMKMFTKFIRYSFGGHPYILDNIVREKNNAIPENVKITQYNFMDQKDYNLFVNSIERKYINIDELNQGFELKSEDSDIDFLFQKSKELTRINKDDYLQKTLDEVQNYFDSENYFDVMLTYVEYDLTVGDKESFDQIGEKRNELSEDEDVEELATFLSKKYDVKSTEGSYVELEKLKGKSKNKKHIMDIFKANMLIGDKNYSEAKKSFIDVLKINSNVAGVYKDLGGIYYSSYQTNYAWLCWDIARTLSPKHDMLKQINEMEKRMKKDYPEFF